VLCGMLLCGVSVFWPQGGETVILYQAGRMFAIPPASGQRSSSPMAVFED